MNDGADGETLDSSVDAMIWATVNGFFEAETLLYPNE